MPELSSTARTLIALKKLEAATPNVSVADAARACISDILLARAFFDLTNNPDNLTTAKDASAHYAARAQDTMLAAQFDRTLTTLEHTLRDIYLKQDELLEKLKKTWEEVRAINIKILKQFDDAIVKNFDVKSLRESSQIHKQYQDIKNLQDPTLSASRTLHVKKVETYNDIMKVYADIVPRLPDSDKADTKKFPPPVYTSIRQPGGKSST